MIAVYYGIPSLIGDPFLIDVLVESGKNSHHFPSSSTHHYTTAHSIQHIDGLCLPERGDIKLRLTAQLSE